MSLSNTMECKQELDSSVQQANGAGWASHYGGTSNVGRGDKRKGKALFARRPAHDADHEDQEDSEESSRFQRK